MKFRINSGAEGEITPFEKQIVSRPVYLFLFAFLLQLLYVAFITIIPGGYDYNTINFYFPPAVTAAGEIVVSGINEFSGKTDAGGWNNMHTSGLISMVVFYFFVPALLLLTYFKWKVIPIEERMKKSIRKTYAILIVFGAIVINLYFLNWSSFAGQITVRNNINRAQKTSGAADIATGDVSAVFANAMEFLYIPVEKGGGGGKWGNIKNGDGTIRNYRLPEISGLHNNSVRRVAGYISAEEAKTNIVMKIENDTTLAVSAVSNTSGGSADFSNADGRKGKVQVSMVIFPSSYKINIDNR